MGIIHKYDLARFGYRLDTKVGKKLESFYIFGYLGGTYHKILAIWKFLFSKSGEFGPFFELYTMYFVI